MSDHIDDAGSVEAPRAADRTEAEWREALTPEQYKILRKKGTERAFTGEYWDSKKSGMYRCAGCGLEVFDSDAKYDSGTGWPSFDRAVGDNVDKEADNTLFMRRTEVLCSACGGHLGHVFSDGPATTGERYCINSAALRLEERDSVEQPNGGIGSDGVE